MFRRSGLLLPLVLVLVVVFSVADWSKPSSNADVGTGRLMRDGPKRMFQSRGRLHPPFSLPSKSAAEPKLPPITKVSMLPKVISQSDLHFPRFHNLFLTEAKPARMSVPEAFAPKVKRMFSSYPGGTEKLDFIESQTIVTTYNKWTDEYSLFNEVRRYRPGYMEKLDAEKEAELRNLIESSSGEDKCDFCAGDRTAVDIFGRFDGKHCYTASNVAKYESWHSLIVSKHHDPLYFPPEAIRDYMVVAHKWFDAVHKRDPEAVFPHLMWDAGPRASASQIHQHMQISLTHDRFYTRAENTKRAAISYEEQFEGRNYWHDVLAVHDRLGLAVRHGNAMLISHLCPIKERELIVIAESSRDPDFAELLAIGLQTMKEDLGTRAFSLAVLFHPLSVAPPPASPRGADGQRSFFSRGGSYDEELERRLLKSYPTIARVVDRGSPVDRRSDVGAMEFFGANNVGADPYHIMPFVRQRLTDFVAQKGQ